MSEEIVAPAEAPVAAPEAAPVEAPVVAPVESEIPAVPPQEASVETPAEPVETPVEPPAYEAGQPIPLEVNLGQLTGGAEELAQVHLVVPEEHAALLTEAGLNPAQVAQELWSGEFGLSDETKQVLYDKYGKAPIDIALEGIRSAAAMEYMQGKQQDADKQAADDAAWSSTLDLLGGAEEGEKAWAAMDDYARKNFSPSEIEQFNAAMDSGNSYLQRLAVLDLKSRVDNGVLNLLEGGAGSGSEPAGYLTAEEFRQAMISGEYLKDPAKYDAMRQRGINQGL